MAELPVPQVKHHIRRCPECGQNPESRISVRVGFWRDSARWSVAAFAVLLVALQFSTVWWLPGWLNQMPTGFNDRQELLVDYRSSAERMTWGEVHRAAEKPSRDRLRIMELCQQALKYSRLQVFDPAATITVAKGWSSASRPEKSKDQWRFGFPRSWLYLHHMDYPSGGFTFSPWGFMTFDLPCSAPGRWISVWLIPSFVCEYAAKCLLLAWLGTRMCRSARKGFPQSGLRKHWVWLGLGLLAVQLCSPPEPTPPAYAYQNSSGVSYSLTPGRDAATTKLTINDVHAAAESDAGAARFAQQLMAAIQTADPEARFDQGQTTSAVVALMQRTPQAVTLLHFGWPGVFLRVTLATNEQPAGMPPVPGQFRCDSMSIYGGTMTFNDGAWPGRVTSIQFNTYDLLACLMLTAFLCWLLNLSIQSVRWWKSRRRRSAGQCRHCGYDLKGLSPNIN